MAAAQLPCVWVRPFSCGAWGLERRRFLLLLRWRTIPLVGARVRPCAVWAYAARGGASCAWLLCQRLGQHQELGSIKLPQKRSDKNIRFQPPLHYLPSLRSLPQMKTTARLFAIAAAPAAGSKLRLTQGGTSALLQWRQWTTGSKMAGSWLSVGFFYWGELGIWVVSGIMEATVGDV